MDKAVISSRLKAIRHYFAEDALVFFQPNDPADLSRVMLHLYKNPELRTRFAANAKREYAPLSWDVMKERYLAMTASLVGKESETDPTVAPASTAVAAQ
jgi:glycosyltransferase involved in cell wall biosynthesis